MRAMQMLLRTALFVSIGVGSAMAQTGPARPADGYTIHVTAPHVVNGKVMGPYHHYCKVVSPEPVIECLIYESTEPRQAGLGSRDLYFPEDHNES
jgi:hypothetical protein